MILGTYDNLSSWLRLFASFAGEPTTRVYFIPISDVIDREYRV